MYLTDVSMQLVSMLFVLIIVLYFFYYEGKIILTNGFVKKTQKTPKEEIQIAKDRRKDFIERVMKDENI